MGTFEDVEDFKRNLKTKVPSLLADSKVFSSMENLLQKVSSITLKSFCTFSIYGFKSSFFRIAVSISLTYTTGVTIPILL